MGLARIDKVSIAQLMAMEGATIWIPYFYHKRYSGIHPGVEVETYTSYHKPDGRAYVHHYDGWYLANPNQFHPDPNKRSTSSEQLEWWCVRCSMDSYPSDPDSPLSSDELYRRLHKDHWNAQQTWDAWLEWANEVTLDGNNLVRPSMIYTITSVKRGKPPFMTDDKCPMYVRLGTWSHRWRERYGKETFVDADGKEYILPKPSGEKPYDPPGVVHNASDLGNKKKRPRKSSSKKTSRKPK